MKQSARLLFLSGAVMLGMAASAVAAPVTPSYDTFGTLTGATFGGSGIPNHAVAVRTFDLDGHTFTLGLTAHQRFVGPNLANDGAGTFTAQIGESDPGLATWNFAYYIDITAGASLAGYAIQLLYDFDPGAGTDEANLGRVTIPLTTTSLHDENSQNLGFGFLDIASPFVTPPTYPSFDPYATGEYSFALRVLQGTTVVGETVAINVNTVPEPGSMILCGLGALGAVAGGLRRRKN